VPTREHAPPVAAPLGEVDTPRLALRRFRAEDLDELAGVFAQPQVWWFPYGRGFSRDETQGFIAGQNAHWDALGFGPWLARRREDASVVGFVGLSVPMFLPEVLPAVEVGWRFSPEGWGRGYATEGAAAALDQAFSILGLERVCSVPQAGNPPSARVAERLGMTLRRQVTIPATDQRGEIAGLLYEIEREDWLRHR
jgi:RimJ/RimL family protein N-acetyltransferase